MSEKIFLLFLIFSRCGRSEKIMMTEWIVAISTVVYVVATIFIMIANRKATKLSMEQMREEREQFATQQRLAIRPYLNLYIARKNSEIDDKNNHIQLGESIAKNARTFSIRNIGNGTAKDIKIQMEIENTENSRQDIAGRNRFLLVNKEYVYDFGFNKFEKMKFNCTYTDLYDYSYQQSMELIIREKDGEIVSRTFNPVLKNE